MSVGEAISQFNSGAGSVVELLSSVGVNLSANTYRALRKEDKRRLHQAARKVSMKACLIRRKKRGNKQSKGSRSTASYVPGGFGLKKTLESDISVSNKKKQTPQSCDKPRSVTFVSYSNVPVIKVLP